MCITEYNEAKTLAQERREGWKEGWAEGITKGALSVLANLVRKGMLSEDGAAAEANMTVNEFREKLAALTV